MKKHLIFVLYDSVANSVFDSQVAEPLLKQQKNDPMLEITIISFEKNLSQHVRLSTVNNYPTLKFIFLKKGLFITSFFLVHQIQRLRSVLKKFTYYNLIARGPLAGYISLHATSYKNCKNFTVQARGLLAEEYQFAHAQVTNYIMHQIHRIRAYLYWNLEKAIYSRKNYKIPTTIEAVSPALKNYLIENFNTQEKFISIAALDIPQSFSSTIIDEWKIATRKQLEIPSNAYVYCYNGSIKPWQCPHETVTFFKEQLQKNPKAYLLILTHETDAFQMLIQKYNLIKSCYKILNVPHKYIYRFLAAADAGVIFREKNTINWTSRPTKVLEYQAVGLSIVHNNTIAILYNS